jgi:hypothetical protein
MSTKHDHPVLVQQSLLQSGFQYMREKKCELLYAEREEFDHTRSARHAAVAYEKTTTVLHILVYLYNQLGLFHSACLNV